MVQLNQNFINSIAKDMPAHLSMDDFIAYSAKPLRPSIRVNTLKIASTTFVRLMQAKGWHFEAIPWCQDGFWVTAAEDIQLGNTIEHIQGLFYIQEASSMLPPHALFPEVIDKANELTLLDMASAPGSKTTQLAAMMHNQGLLVANEYSSSRVKVLHANVLRMGVKNCALTHFDARVFGEYLYETFDAILLDAPCSGEGTVRKDPDALKHWDFSEIEAIAATQKDLIESAFLALKPGGSLVYSTCTLNQTENQSVCQYLKQRYPNAVEFVPLNKLFTDADKACTPEGFLHVWPQIYDSEGFFVAKITKTASVERAKPEPKAQKNFPFTAVSNKQSQALQEYFSSFNIELKQYGCLMQRDDEYWLFPDNILPLIGKIRFQRLGIKVADGLKKGFKVRHEAITALANVEDSIALDEQQASDFLMGRDIMLASKTKPQGEKIVCYQDVNLGLVKHLGNKLKNSLPRELVKDKIAASSSKL
ncbi:16S rRNA (cytosine(1407)-C(5))-methyltransferase RsmF [Shewanella sp. Isolate11]|uniref:16S rRNA (cytosine(1407)-C(5))-methyltransferase RsmF n=1 Tax=Shewanella sp. Isolate11 TaxID=2908530 RepID=UPI001EFD82CC|nr:16S rRNA (cytosine(1407)-C(5))-methyltransferase RsmF [Shewanella sp. Isolate11]MCG9696991.1 16S rRNA (cytosine(1407)-C(5))-methyltransferase RsmF [Shewanella sp. Isolate11]